MTSVDSRPTPPSHELGGSGHGIATSSRTADGAADQRVHREDTSAGAGRRRRNRGRGAGAAAANGASAGGAAEGSSGEHDGRANNAQRSQNQRGRGQGQGSGAGRSARGGKAPNGGRQPASDAAPAAGGRQRGGRPKGKDAAAINPGSSGIGADAQGAEADSAQHISSRKRNFGGKITTESTSASATSHDVKGKGIASSSTSVPPQIREYADLRSRLIAELGSGQYECSICYNTLTTRQPCWSCDQCYTVLHLSCAKKWASTSVDQANAQLAMQEDPEMRARRGTWRCPGCQFAREDVPQAYWCWCGRVKDPQPRGGLNPHSCGQRCAKGSCPHGGCAEPCHPGPCAPCAVTVSKRCHCSKHVLPMRCSQIHGAANQQKPGIASIASDAPSALKLEKGISCNEPCGRLLNCDTHSCQDACHPGQCTPCAEQIKAKCYCGLEEKDLVCGSEGTAQRCFQEDGAREWVGLWACDTVQQKPYDCGRHFYDQPCSSGSHTTDRPPCPRSPARVHTCPCGKQQLTERTSCEDEIPTCGNKCEKLQPCGHLDASTRCHHGPCPPCAVPVTTPCRCGESKETRQCHEHQREQSEGGQEILCSTLCKALRNCGKHVCNRRCCPLSFQAKAKGKKRPSPQELAAQDPAGFHECNVPCGKPLPCGSHACPMTCHRGPCQRCLQASFEELICFCGRTVLEPPVACGTVIRCNFPCTRPPPACGHPKVQHNCHEEEACPPCVFLTERLCHCGKSVVQAVPCSRSTERIRCGVTCGSLMPCGYHRCEGHCHRAPGDCGACHQTCAKPRKLCGHPCTKPCHAPAACPDSEPCESIITIACPCGHLQQKSKCGASTSNPAGRERALKCNDTCAIAQRNMKLADALGINYGEKSAPATYDVETIKFYASHRAFGDEVERAFNEFINSSRNGMILPPAKTEHRKFIHELAAVYKLASESVDAEPKRSVSIRRLQGSRIPSPLLSETWANAVALHGSVASAAAATIGSTTASGSAGGGGAATPTNAGPGTKKLGGWAAIASGAVNGQFSRSAAAAAPKSVWDSGARRAGTAPTSAGGSSTSGRIVLTTSASSAASSARPSPRPDALAGVFPTLREATPDDWETD
ncbi:FKBP12-associated protein [Tilletia horrida]|uniref:FKBP12-associated protein n=1 Tax=Tilletia horrida TaxID=155126 RepID=A0AAN6GJ51_9BASI|nr:FKBP12-associated protein [Tilletia horrida]